MPNSEQPPVEPVTLEAEESSEYDLPDDLFPDDPYYTRSVTAGDYSASDPWNAPGMSIYDFI